MRATLCSLNRCILFSVFYVLPSGVINDDDDIDSSDVLYSYNGLCGIAAKAGLIQ